VATNNLILKLIIVLLLSKVIAVNFGKLSLFFLINIDFGGENVRNNPPLPRVEPVPFQLEWMGGLFSVKNLTIILLHSFPIMPEATLVFGCSSEPEILVKPFCSSAAP
jgi:hypothetical protein